MELPPPPPQSPSWVILSRTVRARGDGGIVLAEGPDVSLELAAPTRDAVLTVSPRVSRMEPRMIWSNATSILSLDPSAGLVLIVAPPIVDDSDELRCYFVCDVAAGTASHLPDPKALIFNEDLGVIAAPGGGGNYMVVEFQPKLPEDEGDATLVLYSSETGEWEQLYIDIPLPSWIWSFNDVVSHDGKLWWVDTMKGLIYCDPFGDTPVMAYVPLDPRLEDEEGDLESEDQDDSGASTERGVSTRHIMQLSDGKFRCVDMSSGSNGATPEVSMRTLTLIDPTTAEWALDYTVSFSDIWASESYKATELPEKAPERLTGTFIHPKNPDVVYFFLEQQHLGVDLRARKVVEYEARVSSHRVLPWELPPELSAGAANDANGVPPASPASTQSSDPNAA